MRIFDFSLYFELIVRCSLYRGGIDVAFMDNYDRPDETFRTYSASNSAIEFSSGISKSAARIKFSRYVNQKKSKPSANFE